VLARRAKILVCTHNLVSVSNAHIADEIIAIAFECDLAAGPPLRLL